MNKIESIAKVCHQANKALCEINGDNTQLNWEEAEQWQKDSAIMGVEYALNNPKGPASAQHDAWSKDKIDNGWKYGEVKDAELKTHPCLVSFDELPVFQQQKDILFKAVVKSLV